jgi:predicted nucleotide-binding protein (sugar kinase/HSP70/actin superfamily)
MMKVGIPQALLYYQYYPMWKAFFEELGAEVVVSSPTTRSTLAEGSARVVADTCLPAKVFIGHVLSLVNDCDLIFIPVVRSLKARTYNCSKFLGLPDLTKAVVPESPPILEIEIDINQGRRHLYQAIYSLGRYFTRNPLKIRRAAHAAWQSYIRFRQATCRGLSLPHAIKNLSGSTDTEPNDNNNTTELTIAVIGHAYLLYDEHVNYQLIQRLKQAGARVVTPEMLSPQEQEAAVSNMVGRAYWSYEEDVIGAGGHYLQSGIDGIIGMMAFGCGPDSLMMDLVHRQATRLQTTPFICITLEEHTSETGVITRLEAFLDMIHRRKRRPTVVCA